MLDIVRRSIWYIGHLENERANIRVIHEHFAASGSTGNRVGDIFLFLGVQAILYLGEGVKPARRVLLCSERYPHND
jgi:hypothetical protein